MIRLLKCVCPLLLCVSVSWGCVEPPSDKMEPEDMGAVPYDMDMTPAPDMNRADSDMSEMDAGNDAGNGTPDMLDMPGDLDDMVDMSPVEMNCVPALNDDKPGDFVMLWSVEGGETIEIPVGDGIFDYSVDWGDEKADRELIANAVHTYDTAGDYVVRISGQFGHMRLAPVDLTEASPGLDGYKKNSAKLIEVQQWGLDRVWTSMEGMFAYAGNLQRLPCDAPDLTSVRNMAGTFKQATQFNGPIGEWDTSNVSTMNQLFLGAESFNQNINGWDTSNVVNMNNVFNSAKAFNQPINTVTQSGESVLWDVSSVITMSGMFRNATAFNQDIGSWDTSNLQNMQFMFAGARAFNRSLKTSGNAWNVSQVTDMGNAFSRAAAFNQDIGNWDTSRVANMGSMFSGAENFEQNLSGWDFSAVVNMRGILDNSGLSQENYDALLAHWAASPPVLDEPRNVGVSGLEYCDNESRESLKAGDGPAWDFNGDSLAADCSGM